MGRRSRKKDEDEDVVMADSSNESDDELEMDEDSDDEKPLRRTRRSSRDLSSKKRNNQKSKSKSEEDDSENDNKNANANSNANETTGRRRSGRSNKYTASMRVPGESARDLFVQDAFDDSDDEPIAKKKTKKNAKAKPSASSKTAASAAATSPPKSRAQHNSHRRRSTTKSVLEYSDDGAEENEDDSDAFEEEDYSDDDEEEEDETLKIQRILAVRSETRKKWREICSSMTSSEVTEGSRWFQPPENEDDVDKEEKERRDNILEERFLVKWNSLSYMHVSWETHGDLMDQVENAKNYMTTFFRKQEGGLLFGQDERKDGDYFDPGLVEIDRILEVVPPEDYPASKMPSNWMEELAITDPEAEYGIILDHISDPKAFEAGAGRQFLIKWSSQNYSDSTYEFERDLWLMDQKELLMEKLKEYYERTKRPCRKEISYARSKAEDAKRRCYLFLGDNSRLEAAEKEAQVKEYQQKLTEHVFKNGGSLRDYQAEGVTWFLANYVNSRSCILADEMGLGKTLQTAAFCNLLVEKMHKRGPFLICVPLSTLTHWQREFLGWTNLNTIVYHGSAEDRKAIRENEFAYLKDRPQNAGGGINSLYLKKCAPAQKPNQAQWMATVVVTTPEMLVADDWAELSFVHWQVLVVDEAHRLKNHNSKLAVTMRKEQFKFQHKVLLTGTPIQNDVKEFWTLLNFIDPENYGDIDDFMEEYGDMKSKETIDMLHEQIRPYILRRLKEDVEKSVPPKEETLIEVELTLSQKQYYRALYEKNVGFLHKNKKKALDGPSLNNLAMQLRKCCNHLFLLNGVEEDMREKETGTIQEGDFVTNGSGKLVLLDKLLPRLKEKGHRILIFSQFKIMLDILEDYLQCREYSFERIDGSITGQKRQSAIDRFQDPEGNGCEPPFVMLLSTRAGGVGITLTAADTCVIFDSDWNPQNDIQAMARCHRIGQTKSVKVYRLLTRKTYEMQMFHMSSLKMGLDQAVLTGFESSSSGEGAMTKEEVEKLLRHGAYDIFNEDKAGNAEAESNDFVQQDIDSILERRSRKIVHANTGSGSAAAGGTFSKASFVNKTPSKNGNNSGTSDDIDINDPDFWSKMVGEAKPEAESILKPRKRNQTNYSEKSWDKNLQKALMYGDDTDFSDSDGSDSDESAEGDVQERTRWGGPNPEHWTRAQVESVLALIEKKGYAMVSFDEFISDLPKSFQKFSQMEILRMSWSMILIAFSEIASGRGLGEAKRSKTRADQQKEKGKDKDDGEKGGLAEQSKEAPKSDREIKENAFQKLWEFHSHWAGEVLVDAIAYVKANDPRIEESNDGQEEKIREVFKDQLWPSLQGRGWKVIDADEEDETYVYEKRKFSSPSIVMNEVIRIHPELQKIVIELLNKIENSRLQTDRMQAQKKEKELAITPSNVTLKSLQGLLNRYAPKQLLHDRTRKQNRITLRQKTLMTCHYVKAADDLIDFVEDKSLPSSDGDADDKLCDIIGVDARSGLPHPLWTRKHDAILIRSVAKHGWVDIDSNLKDIVNDKEIKWGFPFEAAATAPVQRISEQEMKNLRDTANRAAKLLNDKHKILEALTGFNKNLVIESYGLTQETEDDEIENENRPWRVDDRLLHQASKKTEPIQEAVDLPAKKDFVKRAKYVIQKTLPKLQADGASSKNTSPSTKEKDVDGKTSESHGYVVIDQGYRCNILLAEMVRALIKGTTRTSVQIRHMWQLCHLEAMSLKTMLEPQVDRNKEVEELKRIMDQIALAKFASAKRSTTQGKNVLRVMLGEKPQAPRSNGDSKPERLFPIEKTAPAPSARAKAPLKKKVKKFDAPLGEKAIFRAMKKAHTHNNGMAFGFIKDKSDLGLQLTMIEAYILSAFCCVGMPLVSDMEPKNSGLSRSKTWDGTAKTLVDIAKQQLQLSLDAVSYCQAALTKAGNQNLEEKQIEALASNLAKAESDLAVREEAARLSRDFSVKASERLSKKSVMLMEKVRAYGSSKMSSKGTNKYENFLGPKVPKWFGKELARLAANLDILDDENKPQSWTTADISETIQNNPDYNKTVVSAFLDKSSARQVTSQIAMLSKLQNVLTQHNEKDFRVKLNRAMKQSKRTDDEWEKRPEWWDDSTDEHSFLLLKKLNEYGFRKIMTSPKAIDGFGAPDVDYEDMLDLKLTKPSIQIRANQLVRELHAIEDHDNMLQMVAKRRSSHKFDSLAVVASSGPKNPSPTNSNNDISPNNSSGKSSSKKTTVQTGLKAFFSATPSNGKKKGVVDLKKKPSPVGSKRKESPSPLEDLSISCSGDSSVGKASSPPAEKKLKKATSEETESKDMDVETSNGAGVVVID